MSAVTRSFSAYNDSNNSELIEENKGKKNHPYHPKALSRKRIKSFHVESHLLARYIAKYGIGEINTKPEVIKSDLRTNYEIKLGKPSDQGDSGRCWIFSPLNMMRVKVLKKYGEHFHYSQNFVAFWDKLERANYFLEKMIEMKEIDPMDQGIQELSDEIIKDSGEWEFFCNIVKKYGLVPDYAMPETEFSGNSEGYMETLKCRLSEVGGVIHKMAKNNIENPEIKRIKNQALNEVYSILTKYLGVPPKSFIWRYTDEDAIDAWESDEGEVKEEEDFDEIVVISREKFQKVRLTPLEFYHMSGTNLDEFVHLTHLPYHKEGVVLQGKGMNNVVGGSSFKGMNVSIDVIIDAIFHSIIDGQPVPMGADVKHLDDRVNFLSIQSDLKDQIFGFDSSIKLNKGDRLQYGVTSVCHLMNIVGCDDPLKYFNLKEYDELRGPLWKIENTWDKQQVIVMSDRWLREYGYEFFIFKKYLPKNLQKLWENPKGHVREILPHDPIARF